MIWSMPDHAAVAELKRKILASDALAGRPILTQALPAPQTSEAA